MPDKKKLVDAFFDRHKEDWKTKVYRELKVTVSVRKFFKPGEAQKTGKLDDTPTDEKRPRNP